MKRIFTLIIVAAMAVVAFAQRPNYPGPASVVANAQGTTVTLSWEAPDLSDAANLPVTEDFESYEPFQFGDSIGGWTLFDIDKGPMNGLTSIGVDIPNLTPKETRGSFFVLNNEGEQFDDKFESHSGVQHISTMYNYNQMVNNDWIVSPLLPGTAQKISFWARSYSTQYGLESFNVLCSTTELEVDSFAIISGDRDIKAPLKWTEYKYDLPEGAKYFAIRCHSDFIYMFFVDDITYIPAYEEGTFDIVGYNVYRDGVKLNDEPLAEPTYVDAGLDENTEYAYAVSAVYAKGESQPVAAGSVTGIESVGAEGVQAVYYSLQGVKLAAPAPGTVCIRVVNGKAVKVVGD